MSRSYGSASALEQRRRQAVRAVHGGDKPKDVARIIGVHPRTVFRWLELARVPNADGLAAKPHPAPATRLNVAQQRQLESLLARGSKAHGWHNEMWTTKRIAELIRRHFGVSLHHDHVGRFLHKVLKWSPQKPRKKARERDEKAIQRWRRDELPRIVEEASARHAHLVFLDESGFMLTPTVRRTWGPIGQTPDLPAFDRRDRLSTISAITLSPERSRLNFYFTTLPDNKNVKAPNVVEFLGQLKRQLGGPFTVLWDGSRTHSRARLVKAYLAKHPEIVAETFPAYAPEINPDENVWSWTKYGRLANLAAKDTRELRERINREFAVLRQERWLLDSFVRDADLCLAA
jgi:transposase